MEACLEQECFVQEMKLRLLSKLEGNDMARGKNSYMTVGLEHKHPSTYTPLRIQFTDT